jgi:hypothetical protein
MPQQAKEQRNPIEIEAEFIRSNALMTAISELMCEAFKYHNADISLLGESIFSISDPLFQESRRQKTLFYDLHNLYLMEAGIEKR